jgi:branched-chain amino acid transport system permease protein
MAYLFQQVLNAVPLAALYALLGFAYAIAYGVTKRADLTQGALFAFSGQIFVLFFDVGWSRLWLVFPLALALAAIAALLFSAIATRLIADVVMQPLARASPHALIVASLGVLLVLMETARLASETRELWIPPFLSDRIIFWNSSSYAVSLTTLQLINSAAMLLIIASVAAFLQQSRWGLRWRAVCDDPSAAQLLGVDARLVFGQAYWLAGMLAALASLGSTSYYGSMDFGSGLLFGLKVIMIAAMGVTSSPLKSACGGAALGFAETLWSAFAPILWRDVAMFTGLVLVLVLTRPTPENP